MSAPGPVRLRSADGDPIAASAAFFISRSTPRARPPEHITITGLRIHLLTPAIDGIDVYARHVLISNVRVDGSPFDAVYIGGRTRLITSSRDVAVVRSTLLDAHRNIVSVTAAVDVLIRGTTIAGAVLGSDPGDGIDVEPNASDDPIVGLQIDDNRIIGNATGGLALRLCPHGAPVRNMRAITIENNVIAGNDPPTRDAQIRLDADKAATRRVVIARNRLAHGAETVTDFGC